MDELDSFVQNWNEFMDRLVFPEEQNVADITSWSLVFPNIDKHYDFEYDFKDFEYENMMLFDVRSIDPIELFNSLSVQEIIET
jgi:hypothetical protein